MTLKKRWITSQLVLLFPADSCKVWFDKAQSKPDLRIFLAAWKLGSDNQASHGSYKGPRKCFVQFMQLSNY